MINFADPLSPHHDVVQAVFTPAELESFARGQSVTIGPIRLEGLLDAVRLKTENYLGHRDDPEPETAGSLTIPGNGPERTWLLDLESFSPTPVIPTDIARDRLRLLPLAPSPLEEYARKDVQLDAVIRAALPPEEEPAQTEDPPCLYILIRNDMKSMTVGRAAAHASHASNQMVFEVRLDGGEVIESLLDEWEAEARGFGTAIVKQASIGEIEAIVKQAKACAAALGPKAWLAAEIVKDPEYPLRDGDIVHILALDTCAYLFGRRSEVRGLVDHLELL